MFRSCKVILRPSKKADLRVVFVSLHCGIPNAYKSLLEKCKVHKPVCAVYVEQVRSKHVAPDKMYFFCMWCVWVRRRGCIGSWWGNRREGNHWGVLGVVG